MADIEITYSVVRSVATTWNTTLADEYTSLKGRAESFTVDSSSWSGGVGGVYDSIRTTMAAIAGGGSDEMELMAGALTAACNHYEETDEESEYEFDTRT
ncbi:hypothetical protein ACPYO6_11770 [Georgenia sp. Z1344]|uniref:hypothetical protein n=1 Tax=Georgenia sp. Z1344 TaxID=3416706 RepID=UPI003CF80DE1